MTGEALGRIVGILLFPFIVMALVGGIYYLVKRPAITFRRAMFRWWVVLIGIVVLVLGLLGQVAQVL